MTTVRWTYRAREDLRAIGRYIAQDNPRAARRWVAKLKRRVELAALTPQQGRIVPELMHDDVRELIEGNYRIVYRVQPEAIHVLTVFEGHRQFRVVDDDSQTLTQPVAPTRAPHRRIRRRAATPNGRTGSARASR